MRLPGSDADFVGAPLIDAVWRRLEVLEVDIFLERHDDMGAFCPGRCLKQHASRAPLGRDGVDRRDRGRICLELSGVRQRDIAGRGDFGLAIVTNLVNEQAFR